MEEFVLEEKQCPNCNHKLDRATSTTGGGDPEEGDLTICVYCSTALFFTKELDYRVITVEEFKKLPLEIKMCLKKLQEIIQEVKSERSH